MNDFERILALDIRARRFGFVVFEGPKMLLDCGVKNFCASKRNAVKVSVSDKIRTLTRDYSPSAIVVRKREGHMDRAGILRSLLRLAEELDIPVVFISHEEIALAFAAAAEHKQTLASVIAEQFLALIARLPPRRKCWQSEDYRMSMFDAAAAGMAYLAE